MLSSTHAAYLFPTLKLLYMLPNPVSLLQAIWAVRAAIRTTFWLCYSCTLLMILYWLCMHMPAAPQTRKRCPLCGKALVLPQSPGR